MVGYRRVLLALTPALICAAIAPGWLWYFDITPKVVVLLLGAALALASLTWRPLEHFAIHSLPVGRRLLWLLISQALVLVVATLVSAHPALSLFGSNWRRLGLVSWSAILIFTWFAASSVAHDKIALRWLLRALVWSGGIVSVYGILQYFGVDPFIAPSSYLAGADVFTIVRPPGTLGHADYFACYLLFVIWYALALSGRENGRLQAIALGVTVLALAAVILSGTRAALLGLIVSGAVGLPFQFRLFRRRNILPVIAVLVFCGLFIASPWGLKLRARILWSASDPFGGARPLLWKDASTMVAIRPLLGFGPETFSTEFPKLQSLQLAQAYPGFYYESPHNMLLDAATSQGFLSVFVLLALVAYGLQTAWRMRLTEPRLAVCLSSTLVAATVAQQFTVFIVPTCLLFYLTLSMLTGVSLWNPIEASTVRRTRIPLTVASLALALIIVTVGVRLAVSDAALSFAISEIRQRNVAAACRFYDRVRIWRLPGATSDLLFSRVMTAAAEDRTRTPEDRARCWEQALAAGIAAPQTSEDQQNAYYNLAALLIDQGDWVQAEGALRSAIQASPNWFKPHWALAQLLQRLNRYDEAIPEAVAAVQRSGGKYPAVEATLQQLQQHLHDR